MKNLLITAIILTIPTVVSADKPTTVHVSDEALALARISAGESGFQLDTNDMGGIHEVLKDRARRQGWTYLQAAKYYSTNHFRKNRKDSRKWIAWLRKDLRQPVGWYKNVPWSKHKDMWRTMLWEAEQYVQGELLPPCNPHLWGDHAGDLHRARRNGWRMIDCGETENLFWRVSGAE